MKIHYSGDDRTRAGLSRWGCAEDQKTNNYIVTWTGYVSSPQSISEAEWFLNNKSIGKGKAGVTYLKKFDWPKDATIELHIPNDCKIFTPNFESPYSCHGLIAKWRARNLKIQYFWGDKVLTVHTLTWSSDEDPVYEFDGERIGSGKEASAKLAKISVEKGCYVQAIVPGIVGGGTPTLPGVPLEDRSFIKTWENEGAWVEILYENLR